MSINQIPRLLPSVTVFESYVAPVFIDHQATPFRNPIKPETLIFGGTSRQIPRGICDSMLYMIMFLVIHMITPLTSMPVSPPDRLPL